MHNGSMRAIRGLFWAIVLIAVSVPGLAAAASDEFPRVQSLTARDESLDPTDNVRDRFGRAVAVDGTTVAIASTASRHRVGIPGPGVRYVRDQGRWRRQAVSSGRERQDRPLPASAPRLHCPAIPSDRCAAQLGFRRVRLDTGPSTSINGGARTGSRRTALVIRNRVSRLVRSFGGAPRRPGHRRAPGDDDDKHHRSGSPMPAPPTSSNDAVGSGRAAAGWWPRCRSRWMCSVLASR